MVDRAVNRKEKEREHICFITGTRAEYGLLKHLIILLRTGEYMKRYRVSVIATCMHLAPDFGETVEEIRKDGIEISDEVEMLVSSNTPVGTCKSMGLGLIGISDSLKRIRPDLAVLLGDRFETLSAAVAATAMNIPIAHLHGGELSLGSVDDSFRHAVTKLSSLHFTSTETYKYRVIQMGEHPDTVFNVGALGVDAARRIQLKSKSELARKLNVRFGKHTILVTYHPDTKGKAGSSESGNDPLFEALLQALEVLGNMPGNMKNQGEITCVFTYANADAGGKSINRRIDDFIRKTEHPGEKNAGFRLYAFPSLGQLNYLSILTIADITAGNSSSGIIEAPSCGTWTVNIGPRQDGRIKAESVIDIPAKIPGASRTQESQEKKGKIKEISKEILETFVTLLTRGKPDHLPNPYGGGNTAEQIAAVLAKHDLKTLSKKRFYDLP